MRIDLSLYRFACNVFLLLLQTYLALSVFAQQINPNNLPACVGESKDVGKWHNCWGTYRHPAGTVYRGEFISGAAHGVGSTEFSDGSAYFGEYQRGNLHGKGYIQIASGKVIREGIFENNKFVREEKVQLLISGVNNFGGVSSFIWPTEGKIIRSFDALRKGIDIAGQTGQPIVSVAEGTVLYASNMRGFGNLVIIDHRNGLVSAYGHNKEILVKEGETVAKGQRIALMGDSDAESVRLHFEIRQLGKAVDPIGFLPPNRDSQARSTIQSLDIEQEQQQLVKERSQFEQKRREHEQKNKNNRFNLQVTHTQPISDGSITINVQTNADTASLTVNGEEQGGNTNGNYIIKKVARAGQETRFTITATDINGNKDTKVITVTRQVVDSVIKYAQLNPVLIKQNLGRDAVAIIIGIADYRSLPKAEFANDDARVFYDYAIRALGVKPENIKLLVDADAEEVEIIKAFKTWLPSRVKSTTDVYLFYSGHGLPTQDGDGLYLLPPRADRDFISRTSIQFQEISVDIQAAKPKSVTIFMDACYSGQARSGETLVANARPVALRADKKLFPDSFTVITASQADQISSSSPDLKHGIFSYYLMKGMEGDADANKDGKITLGEMQAYLVENVGRHAGMMSRKQEPQLVGDVGRVLVGGL